jgi:hypothetical protein
LRKKDETMSNEIFEAACKYYGSVIGSAYGASMVVEFLMDEYSLEESEANEIAEAAFQEWVAAYS